MYTWDKIAEAYPDLWVIITDINEEDGEIKSCKLLAVCNSDETHVQIKKYKELEMKFECVRTTFKSPNIGVI
jgi:hypothetical protein